MKVFKKIPDELDAFDGELVVAVVGEDERPLRASNAWLDWRLFGTMTDLIVKGHFSGVWGEKCLVPTYGKFSFDRLLMLGGGRLFDEMVLPDSELGRERWIQVGNLVDATLRSLKVERVGLSLPRCASIDQEKALMRHLESSSLRADAALFVARAAHHALTMNPLANMPQTFNG